MPSFDVVSKINHHELVNAIDQANREVNTRFDFKNSNAKFVLAEDKVTLTAPNTFQVQQMMLILESKFSKRGIDLSCLERSEIQESLHEARQEATIHQGIDHELGKKITKLIKDSKIKVQASIMGDQIRVTGKKRDDLQEVIGMLRKAEVGLPLQFENFRD